MKQPNLNQADIAVLFPFEGAGHVAAEPAPRGVVRLLLGVLVSTLGGCSEDAASSGGPTSGMVVTSGTSAGDAASGVGPTGNTSGSSGAITAMTGAGTDTSTSGNAISTGGGAETSTGGGAETGTAAGNTSGATMGNGGAATTATSAATSTAGQGGISGATSTGAGGSSSTGGSTPSAGCGQAPPSNDRYSIDVGAETREYILAIPDSYDSSRPHRLIFGWHPLGGSAQQVAGGGYYGLQSQSDGSAIFVAPEGLPFQGNNLGWGNTNGGDLEFLQAMLDRFRAELCIDENRIFSTGFSFGGMMSFAAGCAMNGQMRAIAPQAGNIQVSGCESGTRPVAVMGFHGDDDTVVSIEGGRAGRDVFIERNQCTEQTTNESTWCEGLNDNNQPCSCVSYQGCTEGYPLIWCEFNGPHTPAPNSGATIWNFFAQF